MSRKRVQNLAQQEVRRIPDHQCTLPLVELKMHTHIAHGYFVEFRRCLWKWVTVDLTNPDSKKYFKSAAMIQEEKIRHLFKYPCTIHPFSQFRFVWETLMIPVFMMIFVLIPLEISTPWLPFWLLYTKLAFDVVALIDLVIWFFTGYYQKEKHIAILDRRQIIKRYLLSYFFFDLISSQPVTLLLNIFEFEEELHFLTVLLLFKCVRLPTLIRYVNKFSERMNIFTSNVKFITFFISMCVLLLLSISVFYMGLKIFFPETEQSSKDLDQFPMLMSAFSVTRMLMVVGITRKMNDNVLTMLSQIIYIIMGVILEIVILAAVKQFYQKGTSSRNKYNSVLKEIEEFMKYKELPPRLKMKILRYIDFKFQKRIFNEEDVLDNLSSVLKRDILVQRCQRMVEKVEFFKDLPSAAMTRIVTRMRSEVYLPGDAIVLAGYSGSSMYFIYKGSVAVYTEDGQEICHLDDGDHFGEIALLMNEPRVATVVAVKECELFKLSRRDFQEAIDPYPQLSRKIRMLAKKRMQRTLQMMEDISSITHWRPQMSDYKVGYQ